MGVIDRARRSLSESLNDVRTYRVADSVSAASAYADNQYDFEVTQAGRVQDFRVRIYPGPELDLKIRLKLIRLDGTEDSIVRPVGGKEYIDGDDDIFEFSVRYGVKPGDVVRVEVENDDATNAYDFAVDFDVDYAVGSDEALGANL
jgi:hypothetical protein